MERQRVQIILQVSLHSRSE